MSYCIPEAFCATISCDEIKKAVPPGYDMKFEKCHVKCCSEDPCNIPSVLSDVEIVSPTVEALRPVLNSTETILTGNATGKC